MSPEKDGKLYKYNSRSRYSQPGGSESRLPVNCGPISLSQNDRALKLQKPGGKGPSKPPVVVPMMVNLLKGSIRPSRSMPGGMGPELTMIHNFETRFKSKSSASTTAGRDLLTISKVRAKLPS